MNEPKLTKEEFENFTDTHYFRMNGRDIQVKFMPDNDPDLSWVGKFSDHMMRIENGITYFIGVEVIVTDIHGNEASDSIWGCEMPDNDGYIVDEVINDLIYGCWAKLPKQIQFTDDDAIDRIIVNCFSAIEEVVKDNPFNDTDIEFLLNRIEPKFKDTVGIIIEANYKGVE